MLRSFRQVSRRLLFRPSVARHFCEASSDLTEEELNQSEPNFVPNEAEEEEEIYADRDYTSEFARLGCEDTPEMRMASDLVERYVLFDKNDRFVGFKEERKYDNDLSWLDEPEIPIEDPRYQFKEMKHFMQYSDSYMEHMRQTTKRQWEQPKHTPADIKRELNDIVETVDVKHWGRQSMEQAAIVLERNPSYNLTQKKKALRILAHQLSKMTGEGLEEDEPRVHRNPLHYDEPVDLLKLEAEIMSQADDDMPFKKK